MLLEVDKVHTYYGESHILQGVSLYVNSGEIVALLGRNGVGKSTLLKSIIGFVKPRSGTIKFKDQEITSLPPFRRARMGMGYVPENRRLFPRLTTLENLKTAVIATGKKEGYEKCLELFPDLKNLLNRPAGRLSGGEQEMLAIARGLIGNKSLLLLDEPLTGLAPKIVENLLNGIKRLRESSAVILVEQNVRAALSIADRAYVMKDGQIIFKGTPQEIYENEEVQKSLVIER
ncbi:MAG: ABC transporter ATP-binding protein [Candidatus Bathyarchaeia archaeon]